ncbi:hypothetical protein L6452_20297 [Arctium lappa]|uniref:Uncharacterized protein n=1 Tax=Arctium lappa TaxID=4217 RepID=A0ACB9BBS1_ARCLA|nr:hypothetical protein L6452_20297 [Arctium lappa]
MRQEDTNMSKRFGFTLQKKDSVGYHSDQNLILSESCFREQEINFYREVGTYEELLEEERQARKTLEEQMAVKLTTHVRKGFSSGLQVWKPGVLLGLRSFRVEELQVWSSGVSSRLRSCRWKSDSVVRLPPGPYSLPIIGNIFELGEKPHISLASLSKTYGGLMTLKLGSVITIVVSSPEFAKEILLKHDLSFSSRSVLDTGRTVNHHLFSMIWLPVGDQWRRLRRISKEHLFSVQQLDAGQPLRREKIQKLLDYVHECFTSRKPINIGRAAFTTSLNVLSNFIFSTDIARYDSHESQEFKDAVSALADVIGKPNLADFFPLLKPFDPQGLLREANVYVEKLMAILDRMIDQRVQASAKSSAAGANSSTNDVLDLLLDLSRKNESGFSRNNILHLLFDLFTAATDTTTSTLEWAMAELVHNPEKMLKARSELEEITGKDAVIIEESDICSLIRKFDWELEGETRPEDMDMSERFGITLHKNVPLVAIPIKI